LTSLFLALEVICLTLVTIYLAGGFTEVRRFAFPLAFILVAVPWPSGLENFLVRSFTRCDISASVGILGLFGVPAIQHGNVIEVARGWVGIDEACSGIRSLQAATMISLFLGEYYRLGARRRLWCALVGIGCSFGFNLIRTSLLVCLDETGGPSVMARWHDPAGAALLTGGFLLLWFVARELARNRSVSATRSDTVPVTPPSRPANSSRLRTLAALVSLPLPAAGVLLVWLVLVETGTEGWYRWHETDPPGVRKWGLRGDTELPGVGNTTMPPEELDQFSADRAVERRWTDGSGNRWQLYYFRWLPSHSPRRRVATQMAKTHGPEKCLPAMGMTLAANAGRVTVPAGLITLAFQQYFFTDEGRPVHVFYGLYEDPSGTLVLANRRMDPASRIAAALAGSRNSGQSLLEIAVSGPAEPLDAQAALARALPSLIKVEE
jgi:exosortase